MGMLWNPALSVGHDVFDDEHRTLVELFDLLSAGDAAEAALLDGVQIELIDRISQHFEHEERLMADLGFADLDRHRRHHIEFLDALALLAHDLDRGLGLLGDTVFQSPRRSLIRHIRGPDRRFAAFALDRAGRA